MGRCACGLEKLPLQVGILVDIKFFFNQLPGVQGQFLAQFGMAKQLGHGLCQGGHIPFGHAQARIAMAHQFGNADHLGGYAGSAQGHGFEQHGGQAVTVAVGTDHTGRGKERHLTEDVDQLSVGPGAFEMHMAAEVQALDLCLQAGLHGAITYDAALKGNVPVPQQGAGIDQHIKTLFLHQAANRQNGAAGQVGRLAGKAVQMQAVIDAHYPVGSTAVDIVQILAVIVGNRDHRGGIIQLFAHAVLIHRLMVNILGVYGQGVGNIGQPGGDSGYRGGNRAEMGMEMGDVPFAAPQGKFNTLHEIAFLHRFRAAKVINGLPEIRQLPAGGGHQLPQGAGGGGDIADIGDRRFDLGENILEMGLANGPQGKDVNLQTGLLMFKNLIDDKGFGEAGIAFNHVGDGCVLGGAHCLSSNRHKSGWRLLAALFAMLRRQSLPQDMRAETCC